MKTGWRLKPLGEVCTLQRGFDLPTQDRRQGTFPLVSSSGVIDTHDAGPVSGPGVVTGRSGSIGNVFYIEEKFWPLNTTLYVRDFFGNDPRFVYYLLTGFDLKRFSGGTGVPTLNRNDVHSELVLVPSDVSEQRRIVAILDEAFEAIATAKANAEKNLRNAREVFVSHLANVFAKAGEGWSISRVGEIADCCLGKMLDKAKNKGEPKPYLRNLNVRWFNFNLTDLQEMRFTSDEYERYSVRRGDVVICEGGYPGRAAIWEDDEPIFIQKALHRVRFKNAILGRWFLYYLYSQEASGALSQHFTGTGIQHFTGAALSRLNLPLAPEKATAVLVDGFDALASEVIRLEAIYRRKLAALDELKKSLLHRAFNGQL